MRITIEPTERFLHAPFRRLWRGTTESGEEVFVLVAGVALRKDAPQSAHTALDSELMEAPSSVEFEVAIENATR